MIDNESNMIEYVRQINWTYQCDIQLNLMYKFDLQIMIMTQFDRQGHILHVLD